MPDHLGKVIEIVPLQRLEQGAWLADRDRNASVWLFSYDHAARHQDAEAWVHTQRLKGELGIAGAQHGVAGDVLSDLLLERSLDIYRGEHAEPVVCEAGGDPIDGVLEVFLLDDLGDSLVRGSKLFMACPCMLGVRSLRLRVDPDDLAL